MKFQNNATLLRKNLLTQIAKLFYNNKLCDEIETIPLKMFPRGNRGIFRCCIYKERAIVKHRIMTILGFAIEDDDEVTSLASYAKQALERGQNLAEPTNALLKDTALCNKAIFSVLEIACSGCVQSQYLITNACRGCMARPCVLNCPKKAIQVINGQAVINHELCVDCGKCMHVCPYHAIIRVPIPCQEACPVGAISKDESGKAIIDFAKCIYCGQCMKACPFGAVMEKSQFVDILKSLQQTTRPVIAMIAPAIAGDQFPGSLAQLAHALKLLGFASVYEVAGGADTTSMHEIKEFAERMQKGDKFMTSSCCPAYTEAVKKHVPELQPYVSQANTPMHYTAEIVKGAIPNAITVFIGPCIAKRKEALENVLVDYVLTFEELEALFAAKNIDIVKCIESTLENHPSDEARGFATTCGVTEALLAKKRKDLTVKSHNIDGINKNIIKELRGYLKQTVEFNFLEVMGCQGGCIGGPCAIGKLQKAQQAIRKIAKREK